MGCVAAKPLSASMSSSEAGSVAAYAAEAAAVAGAGAAATIGRVASHTGGASWASDLSIGSAIGCVLCAASLPARAAGALSS
jgi:hypothetical protein